MEGIFSVSNEKPVLMFKTFTASYVIRSGVTTVTSLNLGSSLVEGYTPIGVVDLTAGPTMVATGGLYRNASNNWTLQIQVVKSSGSDINATAKAVVCYVKTDSFEILGNA